MTIWNDTNPSIRPIPVDRTIWRRIVSFLAVFIITFCLTILAISAAKGEDQKHFVPEIAAYTMIGAFCWSKDPTSIDAPPAPGYAKIKTALMAHNFDRYRFLMYTDKSIKCMDIRFWPPGRLALSKVQLVKKLEEFKDVKGTCLETWQIVHKSESTGEMIYGYSWWFCKGVVPNSLKPGAKKLDKAAQNKPKPRPRPWPKLADWPNDGIKPHIGDDPRRWPVLAAYIPII